MPDVTTIAGGRLIDPAAGIDRRADLVIRDGRVAAVEQAGAVLLGGSLAARPPVDDRGVAASDVLATLTH